MRAAKGPAALLAMKVGFSSAAATTAAMLPLLAA
jgi:hypothetical protein